MLLVGDGSNLLQTIKEIAEVLNLVVETLAVLVGATWVYRRFISQRENETALEIEYSYRSESYSGNDHVVALEIILINKGKVTVEAQNKINPAWSDDEDLRFRRSACPRNFSPTNCLTSNHFGMVPFYYLEKSAPERH